MPCHPSRWSARSCRSPAINIGSGIAGVTTKLDWSQVDATEPKVLPDVLRQQSGMSTYDNVGSPYKINVSTRGFYASPVVGTPQGISIFVDGVRVNEPDAAEVNFDLLPLEHIKRVEILSGNGTLLGRNSLGGSINLVTRRGEGPPNGEIELMAGTYNSYSAEGSVGATTKSGVDYYVGGNYNYEKGWRQFTRADQWQGFANLGKAGTDIGYPRTVLLLAFLRRDGRVAPDVGVRGDARLQPDRR